jgi:signal transduction histidine kinase
MKLQERNTFGALCHTSHVVTTPSKCSVAILPRNLLPSIPRKTIIALWVLSYAGESMNSLGSLIADLAAIASHEGVLMDFRDEYTLALANFVVGLGHSVPSRAIQLGQQASAKGLSISAVLNVHHHAVERIHARNSESANARLQQQSLLSVATFFRESLSAYEAAASELTRANFTLLQLNEALEMQATRIAQALHDDAGQLLTVAYLRLARAEQLASPACSVHLTAIRDLFEKIEHQLRRFSHELHPAALEEFGLVSALGFLVQGVVERTGLNVTMEGHHGLKLSEIHETMVYRFVQEALTNVARHARAITVIIVFQQTAGELTCMVADDGVGFDAVKFRPGVGLSGIRQRIQAAAGELLISSGPGRGAELRLAIPLRRHANATPHYSGG